LFVSAPSQHKHTPVTQTLAKRLVGSALAAFESIFAFSFVELALVAGSKLSPVQSQRARKRKKKHRHRRRYNNTHTVSASFLPDAVATLLALQKGI
jgi:hypothetical protein